MGFVFVRFVVESWIRFSQELRQRFRKHMEGQGLVEYALILALIAVLVITALKYLQPTISSTLNRVSNTL
jgi:pilus assembly protein Flp/PilA